MAEVCGGEIFNVTEVFHGVSRETYITEKSEMLFREIASPFMTGRYHSWCVDEKNLPSSMKITAIDKDGYIMAMTHENQLMRGVQFHPESILTEFGKTLMSNWLFHCE
jgi:anthranilate synthase component 2